MATTKRVAPWFGWFLRIGFLVELACFGYAIYLIPHDQATAMFWLITAMWVLMAILVVFACTAGYFYYQDHRKPR